MVEKTAPGYTSLTLKASAVQSKNTRGCLLLPSPSASEVWASSHALRPQASSPRSGHSHIPQGDVSWCPGFSFATPTPDAASFWVMPHECQVPGLLQMEPSFQGLTLPAGFLPLTALILTPFSAFTPENVPGEPVTPHWILEGGLWLKVTLEEPVSIYKPGSQSHCPPPECSVTVFLGFSDPNHGTLKPLPVRVGETGSHLDGVSTHTWKSFWASSLLPSSIPGPNPLLHWRNSQAIPTPLGRDECRVWGLKPFRSFLLCVFCSSLFYSV